MNGLSKKAADHLRNQQCTKIVEIAQKKEYNIKLSISYFR